jgi:DNA-binding transcriptional regulator LsrR (DeoR family)
MSDDDLLYNVAKLYYEQRRTQLEIAKAVKTSRSTVSRLLEKAVERNIITIKISYPGRRNSDLEQRLMSCFELQDVRVLDSDHGSEETILAGTGVLAAELIDNYVKDGHILGISYGRSLASTAAALNPGRHVALTVVPIIGALCSGNNEIDGPELVRQFAKAYGGEYHYLPGPLLVRDAQTRDLLLKLPQISETLALAKKSDLVVIGIGEVSQASPIWSGYLDKRRIDWVTSRGGIGHMCGQFFDENGQILMISTNQRSIGIGLKGLRGIGRVIAVASGKQKAAAIRGAMRGRFFNVLVTDVAAANAILNLN